MTHRPETARRHARARPAPASPRGGIPAGVVIGIIIGAVIALAILVGAVVSMLRPDSIGFPEGARPTQAAQHTPVASADAPTDGTHTVGDEIPAGAYVARVPHGSGQCYWARLNHPSGDFDDIIANGTGRSGDPVTVRIEKSDRAFATSGCGQWHHT